MLEQHWRDDADLADNDTLAAIARSVGIDPAPLFEISGSKGCWTSATPIPGGDRALGLRLSDLRGGQGYVLWPGPPGNGRAGARAALHRACPPEPLFRPDEHAPNAVSVVIVGAGPAGLMSANLLGRLDVDVLLIRAERSPVRHAEAITLDDERCRTYRPPDWTGSSCRTPDPARLPLLRRQRCPLRRGRPGTDGVQVSSPFADPSADIGKGFAGRPRPLRAGHGRLSVAFIALEQDARRRASPCAPEGGGRWCAPDYLIGCDGARSPVRRPRDRHAGRHYPRTG